MDQATILDKGNKMRTRIIGIEVATKYYWNRWVDTTNDRDCFYVSPDVFFERLRLISIVGV